MGMNGMNIETMTHEQAVSSQAAERYLLGELAEEELQAFEGHYFDCQECFKQVNRGEQFLRHAREVLDPEPEKGRLARMLGDLRRPVPAFAAAMFLFAVGIGAYQQVQLADARRPSVEASYFLPAQAKGAEKSISVSRKSRLSLSVDFKPTGEFSAYRAQIVAESGKVKYTLPVAAKPNDYSITIGLPASALDPGKYSVVIQGLARDGSPTELGMGSFDLQFAD
jgi:Putative zinc-finger